MGKLYGSEVLMDTTTEQIQAVIEAFSREGVTINEKQAKELVDTDTRMQLLGMPGFVYGILGFVKSLPPQDTVRKAHAYMNRITKEWEKSK